MQTWKRIAMAGVVAGAITLGILPAWAQNTDSPVVDARQERQQQRIQQGVDSGQLTAKEFNRLEREQGRIARAEARMKSDGNLTGKERVRLHNMQDRASRHIYRAKHNKRRVQQ